MAAAYLVSFSFETILLGAAKARAGRSRARADRRLEITPTQKFSYMLSQNKKSVDS